MFASQRLLRSCLFLLLLPCILPAALALSTVTPIFTVPGPLLPGSWFENLAVRPNGLILATRGDAPEIWQIDPATGQGALLVSVSGAFNLTGIAEIASFRQCSPQQPPSRPETYVFGSSHIPAPFQVTPGSAKAWTLQFSPTTGLPTVSLLAALPDAGFINGIASWGSRRVLLGDTEREVVYLMDVDTGVYTTPLTNMTGINGVKVAPGYVYWANHLAQSLSRVRVDTSAIPNGPVEILAADQSIDDFAIAVDRFGAGKAYIAAMYENKVVEVIVGAAPSLGPGAKRVVAENLSGTGVGLTTAVVFGRRAEDSGLLYATVGQGGGNAAIVAIDPSE
ncbi:hypothetical protein B0H63DRAFT_445864 [Podospora didyma]|uniref:Uncharacterized protein n=1 Tax=Podospora didyma TaxID=330526 RepID=A0AAE0NXN0_9PEZI|nr:hypothetical protein B0H63DRAFT_445864 [Podospora didyma]